MFFFNFRLRYMYFTIFYCRNSSHNSYLTISANKLCLLWNEIRLLRANQMQFKSLNISSKCKNKKQFRAKKNIEIIVSSALFTNCTVSYISQNHGQKRLSLKSLFALFAYDHSVANMSLWLWFYSKKWIFLFWIFVFCIPLRSTRCHWNICKCYI